MSDLLDYHDALNSLMETHAALAGEEAVPLAAVNQRVLARDVEVQYDVPAFDNSAMDGYAICGNDRTEWEVVHRIAAGDTVAGLGLEPGQAARIFTGAPIPAGTTAVLMQEDVAVDTGKRTISYSGEAGSIADDQHVRRQAEELKRGTPLLSKGTRLTPAAVGLLAMQGYTHVPCVPQLRVTVFGSGNELVEPGNPLGPGQIYNSNSPMLAALMRAQGYVVTEGGILPDNLDVTREALKRAAQESDVIVCSGGVSVGEEDHLRAALEEVGELTQWRLRIKPGKPFTWGRIGDCRVFMLPGNPVSSFVTFQQLAMPAMQRLAGLPAELARPWKVQARADFSRSKVDSRREFLRVALSAAPDGGYAVKPMQRQGSHMLSGAAFANALAEIPQNTPVEQGQLLTVYPLSERF